MTPRRIVVAVDSFKGTIGAADAAAALAEGWAAVDPAAEIVRRPMADGGEGTLDAFAAAVEGAESVPVRVHGPDGSAVDARWVRLPAGPGAPAGTAVVELASTSGIELLDPARLRPLDAGTRGFGEAVAAALDAGVSRLVLAIGSSASTDGGVGMLSALGARFTDADGAPIATGGRGLADLAHADLSRLRTPPAGGVTVLSDVTSPLLGPTGAAAVFGPQKGADADGIRLLESGLTRLAALLTADPDTPGAGAAGGTGFGLLAWGARLTPGATAVAEVLRLEEAVAGADLVITGEGAYDGQSAQGKAPAHVAGLARRVGTPVALVAGRIAADAAPEGFAAVVSLTDLAGSGAAAMSDPARWLRAAGAHLARV